MTGPDRSRAGPPAEQLRDGPDLHRAVPVGGRQAGAAGAEAEAPDAHLLLPELVERGRVPAGEGLATQRLGPTSRLRIVDAILSGTHEPATSHYQLLRAFTDDDVAKTLKLTDKQKDEAKTVSEDLTKDTREIMQDAGRDPTKREEARKKVTELTTKATDTIVSKLTDDQIKELVKYIRSMK